MLAGLGRLTIDTAPEQIGRLTSYDGLLLEASGLSAPVGTVCSIETAGDSAEAEVIGFRNGRCILMALGQRPELLPDARVRAVSNQSRVDVGPGLLGRVIDGAGLPLRSEEHTSEIQSLMRIASAVFCLEKKIEIQVIHNNCHKLSH